jgi:nitrous oxide reductase accessory protein NosL
VTATDYATGKQVDALAALYVVGSDVSHCAAMEVRRDAQGCCLYKGYDRCQPSTIAFAGRDEAEAFARKHGGKVSAWNELALR